MKAKQQIAVFGSAFNPPTLGHLSVLKQLAHFDLVLLVPSYAHAWGKQMAPFARRCAWVASFIQDAALENLQLYAQEEMLAQHNSSVTTWDLLNYVQQQYPNAALTFVLGPDNLLKFNKFYRASDILSRWPILACPETLPVRSSDIRARLQQGSSIAQLTTPALAANLTAADFSFLP